MNEQTPRDPQQPDGQPVDANDPTPQHPVQQPTADTSAFTAQQPVANPVPADGASKRRGIVKPILIGAGAAVAVLAVAGIGLSVADALDDDRDQPQTQSSVTAPAPTGGPTQGSDDDGGVSGAGPPDDSDGANGPAGPSGAPVDPAQLATATAFSDAIDAAVAAAGGEGATSVEVERDGWKVDVRLADGTEVEVRVHADGREPIVQQDDDDSSSD